MINRILMELYDDYINGNIDSLIEFSEKTFPHDGTSKLFVASTLVMFSRASGFKPRYDCNREELLDIVKSVKEKIGNTNLLEFYVERVNKEKGIHKYFNHVFDDNDLDKHADLIIDYLNGFGPTFTKFLKKDNQKIEEFAKSMKFGPNLTKWKFAQDNNHLISLVLEGKKKATTSLYEEGMKLPVIGEESIICYDDDTCACVVKTVDFKIMKFKDMTEEYASLEGEGDLSLNYWKKVHYDLFVSFDFSFNEDSKIVFEIFELVKK